MGTKFWIIIFLGLNFQISVTWSEAKHRIKKQINEHENDLEKHKELVLSINEVNKTQFLEQDADKGEYQFGYQISPDGSFHHENRAPDGITYGCYGYVDPNGVPVEYYYISDGWGYRTVIPNNPVEIFYHAHDPDAHEHHSVQGNQVDGDNHAHEHEHEHQEHHEHHGTVVQWDQLLFPKHCENKGITPPAQGTISFPNQPSSGGVSGSFPSNELFPTSRPPGTSPGGQFTTGSFGGGSAGRPTYPNYQGTISPQPGFPAQPSSGFTGGPYSTTAKQPVTTGNNEQLSTSEQTEYPGAQPTTSPTVNGRPSETPQESTTPFPSQPFPGQTSRPEESGTSYTQPPRPGQSSVLFPNQPSPGQPSGPDSTGTSYPQSPQPGQPSTSYPEESSTAYPQPPRPGQTSTPYPDLGQPSGSGQTAGFPGQPPTTYPSKPSSGQPSGPGESVNQVNPPQPGFTGQSPTPYPSKPSSGQPLIPENSGSGYEQPSRPGQPSTSYPGELSPDQPSKPDESGAAYPQPSYPGQEPAPYPGQPSPGEPPMPQSSSPGLPGQPSTSYPSQPSPSQPSGPDEARPQKPDAGVPEQPSTAYPSETSQGQPSQPDESGTAYPQPSRPEQPTTSYPSEPSSSQPSRPDESSISYPQFPSPGQPSTSNPEEPSSSQTSEPGESGTSYPQPGFSGQSSTALPSHPSRPEEVGNIYPQPSRPGYPGQSPTPSRPDETGTTYPKPFRPEQPSTSYPGEFSPEQPFTSYPSQPSGPDEASTKYPTSRPGLPSTSYPGEPFPGQPSRPNESSAAYPQPSYPGQAPTPYPSQPSPGQPLLPDTSSTAYPKPSGTSFPQQPPTLYPNQPSAGQPSAPGFPEQPPTSYPSQPTSQPSRPDISGQQTPFPIYLGQPSTPQPSQPSPAYPSRPDLSSTVYPQSPRPELPEYPTNIHPEQPSPIHPSQTDVSIDLHGSTVPGFTEQQTTAYPNQPQTSPTDVSIALPSEPSTTKPDFSESGVSEPGLPGQPDLFDKTSTLEPHKTEVTVSNYPDNSIYSTNQPTTEFSGQQTTTGIEEPLPGHPEEGYFPNNQSPSPPGIITSLPPTTYRPTTEPGVSESFEPSTSKPEKPDFAVETSGTPNGPYQPSSAGETEDKEGGCGENQLSGCSTTDLEISGVRPGHATRPQSFGTTPQTQTSINEIYVPSRPTEGGTDIFCNCSPFDAECMRKCSETTDCGISKDCSKPPVEENLGQPDYPTYPPPSCGGPGEEDCPYPPAGIKPFPEFTYPSKPSTAPVDNNYNTGTTSTSPDCNGNEEECKPSVSSGIPSISTSTSHPDLTPTTQFTNGHTQTSSELTVSTSLPSAPGTSESSTPDQEQELNKEPNRPDGITEAEKETLQTGQSTDSAFSTSTETTTHSVQVPQTPEKPEPPSEFEEKPEAPESETDFEQGLLIPPPNNPSGYEPQEPAKPTNTETESETSEEPEKPTNSEQTPDKEEYFGSKPEKPSTLQPDVGTDEEPNRPVDTEQPTESEQGPSTPEEGYSVISSPKEPGYSIGSPSRPEEPQITASTPQYPSVGEITPQHPSGGELTPQQPSEELTPQHPSGGEITPQYPSGGEITSQYPSEGEITSKRPSGGELTPQQPSGGDITPQYPEIEENKYPQHSTPKIPECTQISTGNCGFGVAPPIYIIPYPVPIVPSPGNCPCYLVSPKNETTTNPSQPLPPIPTTESPEAVIPQGIIGYIPVVFYPFCPGNNTNSQMIQPYFPQAFPVPYPCQKCKRENNVRYNRRVFAPEGNPSASARFTDPNLYPLTGSEIPNFVQDSKIINSMNFRSLGKIRRRIPQRQEGRSINTFQQIIKQGNIQPEQIVKSPHRSSKFVKRIRPVVTY